MSEIVARLRRLVGQEGIGPVALALLARDAADLIERTQSLADEWHDEWQKSNARLAEVDAALAAWGRNEAGDAATIVRIAKAVGLPDSASVHEKSVVVGATPQYDPLRTFTEGQAGGDCTYGDGCPPEAKHYRCVSCLARSALREVALRELQRESEALGLYDMPADQPEAAANGR